MAAIKQQHDEQTQALTDAKSRAETAEKLSEKAVEEKTAAETALNNMTAEMSDLKLCGICLSIVDLLMEMLILNLIWYLQAL
jgi:hypothetical protein